MSDNHFCIIICETIIFLQTIYQGNFGFGPKSTVLGQNIHNQLNTHTHTHQKLRKHIFEAHLR